LRCNSGKLSQSGLRHPWQPNDRALALLLGERRSRQDGLSPLRNPSSSQATIDGYRFHLRSVSFGGRGRSTHPTRYHSMNGGLRFANPLASSRPILRANSRRRPQGAGTAASSH
jgi:hypothetical protein